MKVAKITILACLLVAAAALALVRLPVAHSQEAAQLGDPLPDLTPEELRLFRDGLDEFERDKDIEDGLGPGFNGRSCAECHSVPATGGASAVTVVRFGRLEEDQFDGLEGLGGTGLQMFAIKTRCQQRIPAAANVIARRLTLPIFGDGLIEAIPDGDIIANAEKQPKKPRGRVHWVTDLAADKGQERRVGRFGWKAQQATLLAFSADAYLNEMGITSRFLREDRMPFGASQSEECDRVPDPEDVFDQRAQLFSVDKFAHFMRFLAPPPRLPKNHEMDAGEHLFLSIGCAVCHTPSFMTGPSASPALDRKTVAAFSDFLLHDVGTGDGIRQGDAAANEVRTPPLWGLRARTPYLHDGSAATPEQAILRHGGQAKDAHAAYQQLSPSERRSLLAFLNSL